MARIEAQVADSVRACATGAGEVYWEDGGGSRNRWIPVHSSYILNRFLARFEWQQTQSMAMSIAVTGAGSNYSGGLTGHRENTKGTGIYRTTRADETYKNHLWKARRSYARHSQWCFNSGYMYKTGRTRWAPMNSAVTSTTSRGR